MTSVIYEQEETDVKEIHMAKLYNIIHGLSQQNCISVLTHINLLCT